MVTIVKKKKWEKTNTILKIKKILKKTYVSFLKLQLNFINIFTSKK